MAFSKFCHEHKIPSSRTYYMDSEEKQALLLRGARDFLAYENQVTDEMLLYVSSTSPKKMALFVIENQKYESLCRDARLKAHWEEAMTKLTFPDYPDRPIVVPQEGINNFDLYAGALAFYLSTNQHNEKLTEYALKNRYFPALLPKYRHSEFWKIPVDSDAAFYDRTGFSIERHAEAAKFMWALHYLWIAHTNHTEKAESEDHHSSAIALQGLFLLAKLYHDTIDYSRPALHNATFGLGREGLFRMLFDDARSNWAAIQKYLCDQAAVFDLNPETVKELFRATTMHR